ncbi:hypothetical protein LTR35_002790 [Friedmanniomyces endolithicus]|uniref:CENP-V/GFA domain-containing protein n=1 Tax=Friedmanniomyces endolithicus TaxID=329885 RepID=A0AAN6G3N1_9PEZI|nr:hypothetical protein LTS00_010055 [Friedmanniomyces endolithicus]KAK0289592.1 hypothetical protein LTR35_002790 [Friedmanniomyces endolithicus]KAK0328635.1 hypothetical protein LTR82_000566 [Friedmanniomyces endolithicus]KAK1019671.1 hypothetical protein LTR54_000314 [Friedmanniomyces endolithicus]
MTGGKGSCACGKTKYTFSGDPVMTAICHCLDCRKLSASAFSTALLVPSSNFHFEAGAPVKTVDLKHHIDGIDMTPHFCGNCGSWMCKTADDDRFRGMHIVMAGTLDTEEGQESKVTAPQAELWTKYRLDWVKPLDVKQCVGFE